MTKQAVVSLCIVFSFMFSFIMVGYAALTDSLSISGTMEADTPKGLFITSIERDGNVSRLDVYNASFAEYSTTVTVDLSKSNNSYAGSVRYKITVLNNTTLEYAYRGLYYQPNASGYSNSYISTSNANNKIGIVTDFPNGTVVAPGGSLEFYVTYTIGSQRSTFSASKTYTTLVNYQFGINVETEEAAREAVNDKFLNILNTTSTYEELVDVLDNKFDGSQEWTSNYVGNVGSATSDDAMAVNTIFAGQLQMIIDGEVRTASVLIKHENLDGNNKTGDDYVAVNSSNGGVFRGYGCEMTLYLTTDPLTRPNSNATVYVCVFTCDRDDAGNIVGDWYRIGDSYEGLAPIVGYNGEGGGTGSFITDNWLSSAGSYSPSSNFTYYVGEGESLKALTQEFDQDAIDAFQDLLDEAKAMIDDTTYAGTGIEIIEQGYSRASRFFTTDENGNPVANPDTLRVWITPAIKDLAESIRRAKEEIDNIIGGGS